MSVNDESAGRRADDEHDEVNEDGSVGVGTDGSLVSDVDRDEDAGVGVGTDGSLVSDNDDRADDDREDRGTAR